jgi:CubicO group peptidase (beta-lactamase class C family)
VRSVEGLRGAVTVTRAGSVEVELAGGLADAGSGAGCTPRTRFQIASVSKQFAATAVMLLAESGTVELGEPVARWLPGSLPQWRRVTLHHLLTHTAGVRHWDGAPGFEPSQPMDIADRLALILRAPLLTGPGTHWRYSSPGYVLVGHIVARASGRSYPDFLTERILAPLGLTSTTVGGVPAGAAVARGYRNGQPVTPWDLSAMPGTGDLCSTVGDLARYTTALHTGRLLGDGSLRLMCTPHAPVPGDGGPGDDGPGDPPGSRWLTSDGYGYGHFVGTIGGQTAYFHPGDNPGYQSFAAWLPGQAASIAILANDEAASIEGLLKQLL